MLRDKKSDGEKEFWLNHVIHAPVSFNVHLSLMATSMMIQ